MEIVRSPPLSNPPRTGPLIGVVCERFALLPNDKKQVIAGELDRSVREIERKISVSTSASFLLEPHSANNISGHANEGSILASYLPLS